MTRLDRAIAALIEPACAVEEAARRVLGRVADWCCPDRVVCDWANRTGGEDE